MKRLNPAAQFWGTCGVCEGMFKVKNRVTSLHGFERPGTGYIFGKCYGQGMVAWELSPESAEEFLTKVLIPLHAEAATGLEMFDAGKITWIKRELPQTFMQRRHKEPPQYETITPEHRDWDRAFAGERWRAESKLAQIAGDIKHYKKKLAAWEYRPLQSVSAEVPSSKKSGERIFRVVEAFKTVEEDGGPDLSSPIMTYGPGDDMHTPGYRDRMVPTGRFWSKSIKRKVPYYNAVDATTGRKIATGKATPQEAEAAGLKAKYRLVP